MGKTAKRNFLVTVSGISGGWRTMTGGGATASPTKDPVPGTDKFDIISAPPEYDDIEVVRTYDPAVDDKWLATLRKQVGRARVTVSKQTLDLNFAKIGKPLTYPNALLIGVKETEPDAGSSDPGEIALTFSHSGPA
ncbi:hypothetical protein ACMX2H_17505 [Arthrobacter sulfonylureivorans]|uniref:hypothetical protein n=1 Tax=Arthrobacter sulfonylureivorans TaxID=2486855 RepID=UPI0039E4D919